MIKKDFDLHIRLSESDLNILKSAADKYSMTLSKFILAVMIPYCLKFGKSNDNT